jgi:hypothetical protein
MEKVKRKMIPYSVYLERDQHAQLVEAAKKGQASSIIRSGIDMALNKEKTPFNSGYNQAIRDVIKVLPNIAGIKDIAYKGKYIDTIVADELKGMEM